MKVEFVLNLNSITDASHFVSEISKMVACDVDVSYGNTNGLSSSIGSIIEVYEAWKNDIPVIAYDENGDYKTIHSWLKCCITRADSCVIDICEYIKDFYMR